MTFTYSKSLALEHLGFTKEMKNVVLFDMFVMKEKPKTVLKNLLTFDGEAYESYGFVFFPKLSLSLTGFHDGDLSQKAITVAPPKAWNSFIKGAKPFRLK